MITTSEDLLSPQMVANELGVTYGRVCQLIHENRINAIRIGPKTLIIRRTDLEEFLPTRRGRYVAPKGTWGGRPL